MRPKAIQDLLQLSDKDFFVQVSKGYEQILKHVLSLNTAAQVLVKEKHVQGNRILSLISEEEAAKCLILIDAVRCPRKPEKTLSDHLWKFNDHLSKALYSEGCYVASPDFEYFINYIKNEQKDFQIDDPTDFDEIWRNRLVSEREEAMYVDYIEMDDTSHVWLIPDKNEFFLDDTSLALLLAKAFYDTGCTTPAALQVIAEFWRNRTLTPSFTYSELQELNSQTLDELDKHNLLKDMSELNLRIIINTWKFPIYSINTKISKGNKEELQKIREQWLEWLKNSG
jgi:AbiV family abortive infection protein